MNNVATQFLQKHPVDDWDHVPTPKLEKYCSDKLKEEGYPTNGNIVRKIVTSVRSYREAQ